MRTFSAGLSKPLSAIRAVSIATAVALLMTLGAAHSASASTGDCIGDECDSGAWKVARGEANELSYWGMDPGHNCTNYVAWKLISNGVQRPNTNPGNAADWAVGAAADGYLVNKSPAVGAVAQWDSLAQGYSEDGHVAYIERVNDDGTILVSEDFWLGGSQVGPLTFRTVAVADVSNFIHYIDNADGMRQSRAQAGSWVTQGLGLDPTTSTLSAVRVGETLEVYLSEGGTLRVATEQPDGWHVTDTGVATTGRSFSAVDMGKARPYLMSVESGQLVMMVQTGSAWQSMRTGIEVDGDISAVDLGGLWPTAYLSQAGVLYEVWGSPEGWQMNSTGIEVTGAVSAVVNSAGWPEVFTVENGIVFRSWADELGWRKESTGILATGPVAAARVGDGVQLSLVKDHELQHAAPDAAGIWSQKPTGLSGGTLLSAVPGADSPLVVQVG